MMPFDDNTLIARHEATTGRERLLRLADALDRLEAFSRRDDEVGFDWNFNVTLIPFGYCNSVGCALGYNDVLFRTSLIEAKDNDAPIRDISDYFGIGESEVDETFFGCLVYGRDRLGDVTPADVAARLRMLAEKHACPS